MATLNNIPRCSLKVKSRIKVKNVSRQEFRQILNTSTPSTSTSTSNQYQNTLKKSNKKNETNSYNSSNLNNSRINETPKISNSTVKNKCSQFRKIYLCCMSLGALLLLAAISAIVLITLFNRTNTITISTSTTTTSSSTSTTTSITTVTTASSSTSTTTVTCPTGYNRSASGSCVNTRIDINNCGSIGYICPSNYTSCTAGLCSDRPAVQLTGAIAVPAWSALTLNIDDSTTTVNLSIPLTLYNYTSTNITVSTNGVLCLGACSNAYSNTNLSSSRFAGPTVFCFWDDLMIYGNTGQTVYYATSGSAPNRITTFEFYTSHYTSAVKYYHFQMIFFEYQPNIVKCLYFEISYAGLSATIGVQKSGTGPAISYSYNQANAVAYNKTIVFNTNTGTFST